MEATSITAVLNPIRPSTIISSSCKHSHPFLPPLHRGYRCSRQHAHHSQPNLLVIRHPVPVRHNFRHLLSTPTPASPPLPSSPPPLPSLKPVLQSSERRSSHVLPLKTIQKRTLFLAVTSFTAGREPTSPLGWSAVDTSSPVTVNRV